MQPTSNPSNTTVVANDCSDIPPPYAQADIPPVYVRGNQRTATPEAQQQQQQQRPASAQPNPPNNNASTSSPTTTTNNTTAAIPQNSTRIVATAYARISTPRQPSARALENARLEESIRRRNYTWTMAYLISGLFIVVTFPVAVWYLSHLRF